LIEADYNRCRRSRRWKLIRTERFSLIPESITELMGGPEGMLLSLVGKGGDLV